MADKLQAEENNGLSQSVANDDDDDDDDLVLNDYNSDAEEKHLGDSR